MICLEFLRIFGEKSQKSKRENLGKHELLCREPTPRHTPTPQRGMPSPRRGFGTPLIRHGVALLCRSVAVLRRYVDTIHNEQILDFCFQTFCICTPIVYSNK